jgi:hypothetical protein
MKLKLVVVDFEIPARVKKWGLRIGIPTAILLGGGAVAYAGSLISFSDGQTLHAADLNSNFSNLQAQIIAPVNANSASIVPQDVALNPTSKQMIWQAGTAVGAATDANGNSSVTFPSPFPNGVLTVVATDGDQGTGCGPLSLTVQGYSKTGFTAHGVANELCRVNYIALGW